MMTYNVYFHTQFSTFTILHVPDERLDIIIDAYLEGKEEFTLKGKKYFISNLIEMKIYEFDSEKISFVKAEKYWNANSFVKTNSDGPYVAKEGLRETGKEITSEIIGDKEFGFNKIAVGAIQMHANNFVSEERISELAEIKNDDFDLIKLTKYCKEINDNYKGGNYLSVAMIGRAIIDHVPPIFDKANFTEVANNVGGKSIKANLQHLDKSIRSIADTHLHNQIKKKEVLPTEPQIRFMNDLDVLLGEVVRALK